MKATFSGYHRLTAQAIFLIFWLAGMGLFTRLELSRETANASRYLGIMTAKSENAYSGALVARLLWEEKGTDKFGLPIGGTLKAVTPKGGPFKVTEALKSAFLRAKGDLVNTDSSCQPLNDMLVCTVKAHDKVLGSVVHRIHTPQLKLWAGLAGILLFSLTLVFLLYKIKRSWQWDIAVAGLAALGAGIYCQVYSLRVLAFLNQTTGYAGHLAIQGAQFPLLSMLGLLGLEIVLLRHAMEFFEELKGRPLIFAAISPAMLGMLILVFIPFFMGVYIAFLDNNYNFVGLANFKEVLFPSEHSDTNFYFTLGVTVMWTVLNVSLHVLIGLALALLLSDSRLRERSLYRVLLIVPWAVPSYITALVWKWMFNTQFGPINAFLQTIGLPAVDWLGRSFWTNFAANLITNTWLGFPFMMVVSLGALQSIPSELYEAAEIDGAGRWDKFRHITLPLLKPALFPAIILGTIWTFNMFNVVYLVSGGAPDNKTNILITEAYRAFRVLKNYGLAAAYSLLIFIILLVYSVVTNRLTKGTEDIYA